MALGALVAGGLLSGLGGFFGSQKKGGIETDPYGALTPEQKALMKSLGPYLQGKIGQEAPQYTGDYTAPLTAEEQALVDNTSRMNAITSKSFESLMSGELPEDYWQNAIYKPALKSLQEDVLPGVEEAYAGPGGYWGSARADAVAGKYGDFADTMATQRATLAQRARELPITAAPAYASYAQGAGQILQIPRAIKQYGLDKQYAEWVRTRPENQKYIDQALQFLGISAGTATDTTTAANPWASVLSGVGNGLMMGGLG